MLDLGLRFIAAMESEVGKKAPFLRKSSLVEQRHMDGLKGVERRIGET